MCQFASKKLVKRLLLWNPNGARKRGGATHGMTGQGNWWHTRDFKNWLSANAGAGSAVVDPVGCWFCKVLLHSLIFWSHIACARKAPPSDMQAQKQSKSFHASLPGINEELQSLKRSQSTPLFAIAFASKPWPPTAARTAWHTTPDHCFLLMPSFHNQRVYVSRTPPST